MSQINITVSTAVFIVCLSRRIRSYRKIMNIKIVYFTARGKLINQVPWESDVANFQLLTSQSASRTVL
jgi:hypothetical protein